MRDFKKLEVWERAHQLTLVVYKATASFPNNELYGLTSQVRRAAVSIPANIAEGCGRDSEGELTHFLQIAMGSASELEYHLLLAHDLGFIDSEIYQQLSTDLGILRRKLNVFIQKLKANRQ